jgi:hypothetical protein
MKLLLGFIIPFLLVCLPLVFQIVFTSKRLRHKTRLPLLSAFFISLVAGLFIPALAFQIGTDTVTADWPEDEFRCGNAFIAPLILSYLIDVGGCVVIGIVGGVMYKRPSSTAI